MHDYVSVVGVQRLVMSTKFGALAVAGVLAATSARAHHSFAAEFDYDKQVMLKGTLTALAWTNPHIRIYFDAQDAHGAVAKWQCEGGTPNTHARSGWYKDTLKPGDTIQVEGWRAKAGSTTCNAQSVKLPGGRTWSRMGRIAEGAGQ